jgi:hypothetical protein
MKRREGKTRVTPSTSIVCKKSRSLLKCPTWKEGFVAVGIIQDGNWGRFVGYLSQTIFKFVRAGEQSRIFLVNFLYFISLYRCTTASPHLSQTSVAQNVTQFIATIPTKWDHLKPQPSLGFSAANPGNTEACIIVLLTSCLTGLESAVWQLTIIVFIRKTD